MLIKGRPERKGQRRQRDEEEGEEAERRPEVLDTAIGQPAGTESPDYSTHPSALEGEEQGLALRAADSRESFSKEFTLLEERLTC